MTEFQFLALIVAVLIAAPGLSLFLIYGAASGTRIEAFARWFAAAALLLVLLLVGRWDVVGFWWLWLLGLAAAALSLWLLFKMRARPRRPVRPGAWRLIGWTLQGGIGAALTAFSVSIIAASAPPEADALALSWPLDIPNWAVAQGGNSQAINAHYPMPAQRQALDIVGLNRFGARADGLLPDRVEDYAIYDAVVRAPCAGKVLATRDGLPDQPILRMDKAHPAGNYIIIACGNASLLLAHLREDSLKVRIGQLVEMHQEVARVGNSGHSSEPHRHIHAIQGKTADMGEHIKTGTAIPLTSTGPI